MKKVKTIKELKDKVDPEVDDIFTLEKMEEKKELAWLPKTLVEKLKRSENKGEQEMMILRFIEDSERDLQCNIESLEDDVIRYKGAMLRARVEFERTKNEQLDANYKLWEKFDLEIPSIEEKIKNLTDRITPLLR